MISIGNLATRENKALEVPIEKIDEYLIHQLNMIFVGHTSSSSCIFTSVESGSKIKCVHIYGM